MALFYNDSRMGNNKTALRQGKRMLRRRLSSSNQSCRLTKINASIAPNSLHIAPYRVGFFGFV